MRESKNILVMMLCTVLAFTGCTKHDRSEEAIALSEEIVSKGVTNIEHVSERIDSAEQAGVFTAVRANTIKAIVYTNADRQRLATYYAEKAIAAEAGRAVTTQADSNLHCKARWILGKNAYADGEYGKSLALAKEILAFVGDGTTPNDIEMKCRALTQMADCENKLGHIAESERLFLQCIDIQMESTQHATSFSEIDPLIYTLLSLNDLYIDNKIPGKALPLMAKMDTAMNRLTRCPNAPDWVVQKRRKNVTISKAMVYAANAQSSESHPSSLEDGRVVKDEDVVNHQKEQAESLYHEYQQFQGLDALDKAAEGVYLTTMGRYDEAVRMFDETDSIMRTSGEPITDLYVKTLFNYKYDALQKAGRTADALAMSDRIRQLTDSIRQQERLADVEQMQEIKQKEEEIARKHQSLMIHRVIIAAIVLLLLLAVYIIWRIHRYNRLLTEKNRSLYEQIQQREQAKAEEQRQLQAQPEESLTTEQQLYRRLCTLMAEQQPYTEETLNRDTLAQLLGTNAKYVVQAIHECSHGDTVMDFITRYRLEHVAHLLKTTDDPIAIIGELSGIPSRATLARLFRNAYGMSCSEYREVARAK
jgi:AraC-like DNA-binding protein